ncbi:MAG: UPF0175 family protein [Microscillaceae bacterium]|nr:UPF0175 family protein [Microscillaceae bacterium]
MENLVIPGELLEKIKLAPQEVLIDFAAYLYDKGKLSLGQARKLAQLDLISFQQELKSRNIYLKYDSEELHIDLQNLGLER